MGRALNPKDKAKIVHKRLKACGYNVEMFKERFCPDKSKAEEYREYIEDVNLYNKFYGYITRIEL